MTNCLFHSKRCFRFTKLFKTAGPTVNKMLNNFLFLYYLLDLLYKCVLLIVFPLVLSEDLLAQPIVQPDKAKPR